MSELEPTQHNVRGVTAELESGSTLDFDSADRFGGDFNWLILRADGVDVD
jgi:hypothetical protein